MMQAPISSDVRVAGMLDAFRFPPTRPELPPAALVARFDGELGAAIARAGRALGAAHEAALAWQRAKQGDGLTAAVEAQRAYVVEHLARGDDVPARGGPLFEHLTAAVPAALVAAVNAEAEAGYCDEAAREEARRAERLRERLDRESDELPGRMLELLTRARDRKQQRDYNSATELRQQWGEVTGLFVWLTNPSRPWRTRTGFPWPEEPDELKMRAYEAEAALDGEPGLFPPIEGTFVDDYGGAPTVADAEIAPKRQRRGLFGGPR